MTRVPMLAFTRFAAIIIWRLMYDAPDGKSTCVAPLIVGASPIALAATEDQPAATEPAVCPAAIAEIAIAALTSGTSAPAPKRGPDHTESESPLLLTPRIGRIWVPLEIAMTPTGDRDAASPYRPSQPLWGLITNVPAPPYPAPQKSCESKWLKFGLAYPMPWITPTFPDRYQLETFESPGLNAIAVSPNSASSLRPVPGAGYAIDDAVPSRVLVRRLTYRLYWASTGMTVFRPSFPPFKYTKTTIPSADPPAVPPAIRWRRGPSCEAAIEPALTAPASNMKSRRVIALRFARPSRCLSSSLG